MWTNIILKCSVSQWAHHLQGRAFLSGAFQVRWQVGQNGTVNWENLVEKTVHCVTITSGRAFHAFQEMLGTLSWNGTCLRHPLWKWLSRAVFKRSWVPVRVASSEPADGHQKVVDINGCNEVFPESDWHRENMQTPHLRDRVRTQREFGVEPLLVCVRKCQLGWFQHLIRMPPGHFPLDIFRSSLSGQKSCVRHRTRWRDFISSQA